MEYTTRVGDHPSHAHINYQCPCGCIAGLTYERQTGAEHLGRCCCGRLLWVGPDAAATVTASGEPETSYEIDTRIVTLPWGERVEAALAVPNALLVNAPTATTPATRVLDVVCKMRIRPEFAEGTTIYDGVVFYFCAPVCKERFDAHPLSFLAEEA